jgi:glyoxylase-like metal-dependent hydrolase (beta-lactamase superfamily II)
MTTLRQISDSVWDYNVKDNFGHISVIKLKESLFFIDSSFSPDISSKVRKDAEKLIGLPAKYLLLTHYHFDHSFGSQAFSDCEIISSKATYNLLKKKNFTIMGEYTFEVLKKEKPEFRIIFPTVQFNNNHSIQDNDLTIIIKRLHSHTLGSSFIYIPEEQVVITGDMMTSPPLLLPFYGDTTADSYLWIEALDEIALLFPEIIIPGHGEITNLKRLKEQKQHMINCISWMEQFLDEGGTLEELETRKDYPHKEELPGIEFIVKISKERLYFEVKKKKEEDLKV